MWWMEDLRVVDLRVGVLFSVLSKGLSPQESMVSVYGSSSGLASFDSPSREVLRLLISLTGKSFRVKPLPSPSSQMRSL